MRRGRDTRALSLSLICEDQQESGVFKSGRRSPPGTELARTQIWDFPASRTMTNQCLLFKPPGPWGFVTAALLRPQWISKAQVLSTGSHRLPIRQGNRLLTPIPALERHSSGSALGGSLQISALL